MIMFTVGYGCLLAIGGYNVLVYDCLAGGYPSTLRDITSKQDR